MRIKRFSSILIVSLIMGSMSTSLQAAWTAPGHTEFGTLAHDEDVKIRFAVGSDLHIGSNYGSEEKLENAFKVFYDVDPALNGVAFVGDITDWGTEEQYDTLESIISQTTTPGGIILSMGNHELYGGTAERFTEKTGQQVNKDINLNGIHIITIGASDSSGDYSDCYNFLKNALENADAEDPTAPIFVLGHHGVEDTAYVTDEWYGEYGRCLRLMQQYPQVIHISGHSHATLEDARSIDQSRGFTAIQDGTLGAYFENESGKVLPETGQASTYPEDSRMASQALMIEVDQSNKVTVRRMNLTTGKYMYEDAPWVINTPEIVNDSSKFTYTKERKSSNLPYFMDDAEVTVDNIQQRSAVVSFPRAYEGSSSNEDMIHEYQITCTDQETGDKVTRKIFADYYKEDQKDNWQVKIKGLKPDTTYDVQVEAVTSFGQTSEPVHTKENITTLQSEPVIVQQIVGIDYSKGSIEEAGGREVKNMSSAELVDNVLPGKKVLKLNGDGGVRYTLTDDDYDKIKDNFTLECYFYLPDVESDQCIFSNQQNAGMGFEIENGQLELWCNLEGGRVKPSVPIEANTWNHAVATYDGQNIKMYINGELKTTYEASGSVKTPDPHYYFIGADTSDEGTPEYITADGYVNSAYIYSGAKTADEVKADYQKAIAEPEKESYTITAKATGEGSISPAGECTVKEGENKTYTITANKGYKIKDVLVDGKSVGAVSQYTFENVSAMHTIEAGFEKQQAGSSSSGSSGSSSSGSSGSSSSGSSGSSSSGSSRRSSSSGSSTIDQKTPSQTTTATSNVTKTTPSKSDTSKIGTNNGGNASNTQVSDSVSTQTKPVKQFKDVKAEKWYSSAVNYVTQKGIMKGTKEGQFSPDQKASRSMVVTILYRLAGEPDVTVRKDFKDVKDGSWYAKAVNWAASNNIASGYNGGNFAPEDNITREQLVSVLYRYAKYKEYDTTGKADLTGYRDGQKTSDWSKEAVAWALSKGIISGTSNNTLDLKQTATRAQIASILMKFETAMQQK